jgi:hypothetical protein
MRTLISLLPAFACVGMMLVICLPMIRGRFNADTGNDKNYREEVARLREEVARLREADAQGQASETQKAIAK